MRSNANEKKSVRTFPTSEKSVPSYVSVGESSMLQDVSGDFPYSMSSLKKGKGLQKERFFPNKGGNLERSFARLSEL